MLSCIYRVICRCRSLRCIAVLGEGARREVEAFEKRSQDLFPGLGLSGKLKAPRPGVRTHTYTRARARVIGVQPVKTRAGQET